VPAPFEAVLDAATEAVVGPNPGNSLYLYGSVATGTAHVPGSDVDLVSIGLQASEADELSQALSAQFSGLCRAVDFGAAQPGDYAGDGWREYGNRVFLRHYCVHLAGPDHHSSLPDFAADIDAARGFNGDIARVAERWRVELAGGGDPVDLSRRIGRKSLFAVAGLVGVHDATWTTDRVASAARWAAVEPALAAGLHTLLEWSRGDGAPDGLAVEAALDGVVAHIVSSFAADIGLWADPTGH
jgi:hypothetical protein